LGSLSSRLRHISAAAKSSVALSKMVGTLRRLPAELNPNGKR